MSLDITWCPYWRDCWQADICGRKLTPDVLARAESAGVVLSRFLEKPPCFFYDKPLDYKEPEKPDARDEDE